MYTTEAQRLREEFPNYASEIYNPDVKRFIESRDDYDEWDRVGD